MAKTEYGIQLYSVEDYINETSLREGIKAVAEMGYKYVEFCEFHGHTAKEIREMLEEFNLKCSGSHIWIEGLYPENFDKTVEFHKTLGCDTIVLPGCDWSTPEKRDKLIIDFEEIGKKLEDIGMHLAYHNHDSEFTKTGYDILFADDLLGRSSIDLEVDTFWLYNARVDVVDFLDKYKDRVRFLHLKDGIGCKAETFTFQNRREGVEGRPVGYGETDIKALHNWAKENGVLMIVENENSGKMSLDYSKKSIGYLNTLD